MGFAWPSVCFLSSMNNYASFVLGVFVYPFLLLFFSIYCVSCIFTRTILASYAEYAKHVS